MSGSSEGGAVDAWIRALRRNLRSIFGIPDYARYLAHMAQRHPGSPVLTERQFHARALDGRYGGTRPRCC